MIMALSICSTLHCDIKRLMILKLSPRRHYLKIRQPDAFELRFTRLFTLQLTQFCEQK